MLTPSVHQPLGARPGRVFAGKTGDALFYWGTLCFAGALLLICGLIAYYLWRAALPSLHTFGPRFLVSSGWDPVNEEYGALPFLFGTLVSSCLALLLAVPVSLGTAVFLSELAPRWLRPPVSFLVELLAAVPSVVYGLWGIFVLVPVLRLAEIWLGNHFGWLPIFKGPALGRDMLAASLILAIMIVPFITSVSREVIKAVPSAQREAAYSLGATQFETIKGPVMRYARSGLLAATMLGLARALGETMAVTMVIGNSPRISASLFAPGYTLASVLANEFAEATSDQHVAALLEIALVLFCTTVVVNAAARLLMWTATRGNVAVSE